MLVRRGLVDGGKREMDAPLVPPTVSLMPAIPQSSVRPSFNTRKSINHLEPVRTSVSVGSDGGSGSHAMRRRVERNAREVC